MNAKNAAQPDGRNQTKALNGLATLCVGFGLDQATGKETAKNAKHANAGCSDIASSLARWPCRGTICVFCVLCGFLDLVGLSSPGRGRLGISTPCCLAVGSLK